MATHIIIASVIFAAVFLAGAGVSAVMIIKGEMDPHRDDATTWPPFAPMRHPLHDLSDKQADFASLDIREGFGGVEFELSGSIHNERNAA
jgi:hypothetical protein